MHAEILLKVINAFFGPVVTAANRAMGELGMTGNVIGRLEDTADPQQALELQNQQIEQTVAEGAEAIGLVPFGDGNVAAIDAPSRRGSTW